MYKKSYKSPLGIIYMRSDGENLTGLWFESSRDVSKHSYNFEEKDLPIFDETSRWLDIYFRGKNPDFTPKYKIENLTPFRSQVIDIMNKIPYGKTVTYNDIAKEIAQNRGIEKMSAQAVGGAVGWNPICIIVPCHRVVGTNGSLTSFYASTSNVETPLSVTPIGIEVPTNSTIFPVRSATSFPSIFRLYCRSS